MFFFIFIFYSFIFFSFFLPMAVFFLCFFLRNWFIFIKRVPYVTALFKRVCLCLCIYMFASPCAVRTFQAFLLWFLLFKRFRFFFLLIIFICIRLQGLRNIVHFVMSMINAKYLKCLPQAIETHSISMRFF